MCDFLRYYDQTEWNLSKMESFNVFVLFVDWLDRYNFIIDIFQLARTSEKRDSALKGNNEAGCKCTMCPGHERSSCIYLAKTSDCCPSYQGRYLYLF